MSVNDSNSSVSEAESQALDSLLKLSRRARHSSAKRSTADLVEDSNASSKFPKQTRRRAASTVDTVQDVVGNGTTASHGQLSALPPVKRSLIEPGSTEPSSSSLVGSDDAAKMRSGNSGSNQDSHTSASPTSSTEVTNLTTSTSNDSTSSHRESGSSSSASDSVDNENAEASLQSARLDNAQKQRRTAARHQQQRQSTALPATKIVKPPPSAASRTSSTDSVAHPCPTCKKVFWRRTHLTRHMKMHSGTYDYKCEFCDKAFYRKDQYDVHKRSHTNERPYACAVPGCGKRFTQKGALTRHNRVHLNRCRFCQEEFVSSRDVVLHEQTHLSVSSKRSKHASKHSKGASKHSSKQNKAKNEPKTGSSSSDGAVNEISAWHPRSAKGATSAWVTQQASLQHQQHLLLQRQLQLKEQELQYQQILLQHQQQQLLRQQSLIADRYHQSANTPTAGSGTAPMLAPGSTPMLAAAATTLPSQPFGFNPALQSSIHSNANLMANTSIPSAAALQASNYQLPSSVSLSPSQMAGVTTSTMASLFGPGAHTMLPSRPPLTQPPSVLADSFGAFPGALPPPATLGMGLGMPPNMMGWTSNANLMTSSGLTAQEPPPVMPPPNGLPFYLDLDAVDTCSQ
eukprot:m.22053 g.22053  ORF g.22053 m.22053 type:complete len:627 (+) comp11195_c0_seq1:1581-3461(+)